jgi:glycine cleavage system aminomethyltransferase T
MFTACLTFFRLSRSIKKRHFRCSGADEDVQIKSLTNDQTILVLAGPKARAVMQMVSRDDWSKEGFPWLSVREYFIGFAPATIILVSFSGEHAYKIHVPNASLYTAYTALKAAGETHGLRLFGALAVESMRLEKGICIGRQTSSPAAIDIAPADRPATPAIITALWLASAAATPTIREDTDTMPSFAPSTAARNQLLRVT